MKHFKLALGLFALQASGLKLNEQSQNPKSPDHKHQMLIT
jgi:hypothetical protein